MGAVWYRVLVGIDYSRGKRAEPGDIVDDLPVKQVHNLRSLGAIEVVHNYQAPETEKGDE